MAGSPDPSRVVGDKYEIERHLATGGMGELYVARHVLTTQRVALKVLDRRLARSEATLERFLREVRLGARIGHPGIVQVYDAGLHATPDGPVPYLAMELLQGANMAERVYAGDVTQGQCVDWIVSALDPLAAAHAKDVVHRDLKPENLFLERTADGGERVRLLDLGIARDSNEATKATLEGQCLGTVYYMAPEQSIDARFSRPVSDVWSLGAMLYQVVVGRFPFDGDTIAAVLLRACREPHLPVVDLAPHVDPRLAALIDRCLSKDAGERPADAGELRAQLTALLALPEVRAPLDAEPVATWTFTPVAAPEPPHESPFAARLASEVASLPTPPPSQIPQPTTAPEVSLVPTAPSQSGVRASSSNAIETAPLPAPPPRRALPAVLLAVLALAAVAALALRLRPSRSVAAPAALTVAPAPAQPTVVEAPAQPTVVEAPAPPTVVEAPAQPTVVEAPAPTLPEAPRARRSARVANAPAVEPVVEAPAQPAVEAPAPPAAVAPPPPAPVVVARPEPPPAPAVEPPPTPAPTHAAAPAHAPAPTPAPRPAAPPSNAPAAPDFVTF